MGTKDTEEMANSVDPDQTAPSVWSGSPLFGQVCLCQYLDYLCYICPFCFSPEIDVWSRTAELCNILKEMDTSHVKLLPERKECKYGLYSNIIWILEA